MEGASVAGNFAERAKAALDAGCDMVLVCNNREAALEVLESLDGAALEPSHRLARLAGKSTLNRDSLRDSPQWQAAVEAVQKLVETVA